MSKDTDAILIVTGFGVFAVALVAGGIYLAKKMSEAKAAEEEKIVPPPTGGEVPYEPVA